MGFYSTDAFGDVVGDLFAFDAPPAVPPSTPVTNPFLQVRKIDGRTDGDRKTKKEKKSTSPAHSGRAGPGRVPYLLGPS
jgi:hypothetical protein